MFDWLKNNALSFGGVLLTIIFGLISIYFYYKSKRRKLIAIACDLSILQVKSHPEIVISFRKRKIQNLSRVYLCFWNAGQVEVRSGDIPPTGSPNIEFADDTTMLSFDVKKVSSDAIGFRISNKPKHILNIEFDFLNPNDGAVIEVLFEDTLGKRGSKIYDYTQDELPFKINGSIIGAEPIEFRGVPKLSTGFFRHFIPVPLSQIANGIIILFTPLFTGIAAIFDLVGGLFNIILGSIMLLYVINIRRGPVIPKFAKEYFHKPR